MSDKELVKYLSELIAVVSKLQEKPIFNSQKKGAEINTKESLTSQEHYTVTDLIKTFIREKPELLATAKEVNDDDDPKFNVVDAFDDIIDIEEKLQGAVRIQEKAVQNSKEQLQQQSSKNEKNKVENETATSISEKSSTVVE